MVWLGLYPESSVSPKTRKLHLPRSRFSVLLDRHCLGLYFATLLWPVVLSKSSLMPSFLPPLHPVTQVLLSCSPKYYQLCSFISLPVSTVLVRATATCAWTFAGASLLSVSHSSSQGHSAQLARLYTAHRWLAKEASGAKV